MRFLPICELSQSRDQNLVPCKISTPFLGVNVYDNVLVHDHTLLYLCHFSCIRAQNSWYLITDDQLGPFSFTEHGPRSYLLHNIQILLRVRNNIFFLGSSITVVTVISEYSQKKPESSLSSLFVWRARHRCIKLKNPINLKCPVWDFRALNFQNINTIKQCVFDSPHHWLIIVKRTSDGNKWNPVL